VNPSEALIKSDHAEVHLRKQAANEWVVGNNSSFSGFITATGGTVSDITVNGVDYRVHAFTTVGTSTFEVTSGSGEVDVLVVAGGGGGGLTFGPGGGAGGLVFGPNQFLKSGSYEVSIGAGGSGKNYGADGDQNNGENGENSSFGDIIALGGGGGYATRYGGGSNGGSGGGADSTGLQPSQAFPNGSPYGYGNDGSDTNDGGGGGGAGEPGSGTVGGDGLNQVTINGVTYNFADLFGTQYGDIINGEAWFAGGGSGGNYTSTESKGGGGARGIINSSERRGAPGDPNTGGGGGCMNTSDQVDQNAQSSGDGGSGIVLVTYRVL
jgi:hypothetical protein